MGTRVVSLRGGEYDVWRREDLRRELDAIEASESLIIDLGRTTFMDAGAVGLLLGFRKRLRDRNPQANVTLRHTPPMVRRILQIAGAESLFDFSP